MIGRMWKFLTGLGADQDLGTATRTSIGFDSRSRKVIVTHTRPVGTQWLTPDQAREMGRALLQSAEQEHH